MGKGSFILYDTDLRSLSYLTDAQAGKLFKAIANHRLEGSAPDLGKNPAVNILYNQIIEHIAINEEKYQELCAKRSEAINKRWSKAKENPIQKYTNEYSSIQENTNGYINDNDNVNDTVNDNDIDNVNGTVAFGVNKENKRKNYYNKNNNVPALLRDEPSYDLDAFTRKAIGLKYQKKENQQ